MLKPNEPVMVSVPVVALTESVWKPFCERTGPEKVVFAMGLPLAQGLATPSVQRQVGLPVCVADDALIR
jgi:hypothetical protein